MKHIYKITLIIILFASISCSTNKEASKNDDKTSFNDIERVARKYGGKFDDDLLTQTLFSDELDNVFGPAARTSFHGQIKQAVKGAAGAVTRPADTAVEAVAHGADKLRGINQENAFKAIKALLNETP